jgi:hypothetical protein
LMVRVCPECFGNSVFQRRLREIRRKLTGNEKCDYHPTRKGIPVDAVGPLVDTVLRENYGIGEYMFDHQEGSSLQEIIAEITDAEDYAVADAFVAWLIDNDHYWPPDGEEAFYATDQNYVEQQIGGWQQSALWSRFRHDVVYRQRFFNHHARELLKEIFDGVQFQADAGGHPAFYELAPAGGKKFYRARVVGGEDEVDRVSADPAAELGPPPFLFRRAGRMNASGISVFYAAFDEKTAIAELRPPVGGQLCIAAFELTRPILVLDLTRFAGPGKAIDLFARDQVRRRSQWAFMRQFASEISKPILPGDEHLEYVPAQMVAEYLTTTAFKWKGKDVTADAIIFGSAQRHEGCNIAILGSAAAVVPKESQPNEAPVPVSNSFEDFFSFIDTPTKVDPALVFVAGSLKRIRIESAEFKHEEVLSSPYSFGAHDF